MAALYIRAETGGAEWQVWPSQDVIPPGTIREATPYFFELRDCSDAISFDLLIDDIAAEALRSRDPSIARWRWKPGFHAGSVEVTLRAPTIGVRRIELTTDPDLRKLTRDDFDTMVREILEDTFALFSLSSFRKGIARQVATKPPAIARLEFLRSRFQEILKVLADIERSPRRRLRSEQISVPFHSASRATAPEIIKSFRSGRIRTEITPSTRLPSALKGRLPETIRVRKRRRSLDIPEHRQIKACVESWSMWLSTMADTLGKLSKAGDVDKATAAQAWSVRSRHIARSLADATRLNFLSETSGSSAVLRMSSLFRNDPHYHRFYRLWHEINLGLASLFGDFLQMPLARTYELYELWCLLRLLRTAVKEYGGNDLDLSELFVEDHHRAVTISARSVTLPIGNGNVICFQRRYQEYWLDPSGEGSFSRTMIPDIVFTGPDLCAASDRIIVLDAKYRIEAGLNDALSSIHAYRDALVRGVDNGDTQGIVGAAYLLTPHIPSLQTSFESTPLPGRLFHPEYRSTFQFGAVTLRPGMDDGELLNCLREIIADAAR